MRNWGLRMRAWLLIAVLVSGAVRAEDSPAMFMPQLLGAQYTFVDQHQYALHSPYAGELSLLPGGDTEQSHTFGAYFGIQLPAHLQFYLDAEMFKGEGLSNATGLGGVVNGDVVHSGSANLGKRAYMARHFLRWTLPLGTSTEKVKRDVDQLPGEEPVRRIEAKIGKLAASDDFDKNRYANSPRTQFLNASFVSTLAWDYAADTRGYTNGANIALVLPPWTLRYGVYQMPTRANGQTLEWPLKRARGEQIEADYQPHKDSWVLRLLVFRNIARMGIYEDALAIARATGALPDIRSNDHEGRRKYGFALNTEIPIADGGETGLFARAGWNDGKTESFAFTEVDDDLSVGAQVSGAHWHRPKDRVGIAFNSDGLSGPHRQYLAAGGQGFLLGDGALNYGRENIAEVYYAFQPGGPITLSPDFQFIEHPGFNRDRGPVKFIGVRVHLNY